MGHGGLPGTHHTDVRCCATRAPDRCQAWLATALVRPDVQLGKAVNDGGFILEIFLGNLQHPTTIKHEWTIVNLDIIWYNELVLLVSKLWSCKTRGFWCIGLHWSLMYSELPERHVGRADVSWWVLYGDKIFDRVWILGSSHSHPPCEIWLITLSLLAGLSHLQMDYIVL